MDVKIIVALIGLMGLVLSNIGMWAREIYKHKDWKQKNGDIGDIKEIVNSIDNKTDDIDKGLAEVKTEVLGIKSNCLTTVGRFEKGLATHSQQILDMAKNNRKRS